MMQACIYPSIVDVPVHVEASTNHTIKICRRQYSFKYCETLPIKCELRYKWRCI